MNAQRVEEIVLNMRAFSKDTYSKEELISEMLELQKELVQLTFDDKQMPADEYRIWDVENRLEEINRNNGNIAGNALKEFKEESKEFCNLIRAEISGYKGESKAYRELRNLAMPNVVLRNIELDDGQNRTELDMVVITPGSINIVEVKNYGSNRYIDSNGDCFRNGKYLRKEYNLYQKMYMKEMLLRKILMNNDIVGFSVNSIVVFTNDAIEVHNCDTRIRICFASQLHSIIDSLAQQFDNEEIDIETVAAAISHAEQKNKYAFSFDVNKFKKDFATIKVMLEEAETKKKFAERYITSKSDKKIKWDIKSFFASRRNRRIGTGLALAAVSIIPFLLDRNK